MSSVYPIFIPKPYISAIRYALGKILSFLLNGSLMFQEQATRWDDYLHIFDPRIHWSSLINLIVIVVFLCAMVSMILVRSVSRDVCLSNTVLTLNSTFSLPLPDQSLQCY